MADTTPWVEIQRQLLDGSRSLLTRSVETQQFTNQLLMNGLDTHEMAQRHGIELANTAAHGYLNSVTPSLSNETSADLHDLVDESFDWLLGVHTDTFGAFARRFDWSVETYEDLSVEYVESVDDQFDRLLDAHQQFEINTIELEP